MQHHYRATGFGAVALLVLVAGCSPAMQMARVTGTVTHKGQPVTGGVVQFLPEKGPMAAGALDPSGRFTLTTSTPGDGAFVGAHRVCVTLLVPGDGDQPPGWKMPNPANIPTRYRDFSTTPLHADVAGGQLNEFTFELAD